MSYNIPQVHEYFKRLGVAVNNYQKMFGIKVEVYRLEDRKTNDYLRAYGRSQNIMSSTEYKKVMDIDLICFPQSMYDAYSQGSSEELTVYTHKKDLLVGDVIKFNWLNNIVLEFTVQDDPKTYLDSYFQYTIKSLFQVNNKDSSTSRF